MSIENISIIILSKNEERYIDSTLDMVFQQKVDMRYEVIVIDSGSGDSTLDIAKNYPVKILEIPSDEFSHGETRNQGARIANGDIVVFLNADATPKDDNWLKNLTENFKNDEKIVAVYSRIYPRQDCNPLRSWEILNDAYLQNDKRVKYIDNFDKYNCMNSRDKRRLLSFQTISCAIRKHFLLKNPFKQLEFGEDLEWSKRIMEKGFKVVFEPESVVLHSHNFYFSFIKTFKKYFDDAKLNNYLLNIWSWRNFPMLGGYIVYKVLRDINYILSLNKDLFYKTRWSFYSLVIRLAEFFGIILGANSQYIPCRLQPLFSLVNELKKG
jgi:rhamnosyltransferase